MKNALPSSWPKQASVESVASGGLVRNDWQRRFPLEPELVAGFTCVIVPCLAFSSAPAWLTLRQSSNRASCPSRTHEGSRRYCHSSIVSLTRSAIAAGSSSKPNNTVRSKPWGPVMTTRTPPRNGSAAIQPSYCSLTAGHRPRQQFQSVPDVWQRFPCSRR